VKHCKARPYPVILRYSPSPPEFDPDDGVGPKSAPPHTVGMHPKSASGVKYQVGWAKEGSKHSLPLISTTRNLPGSPHFSPPLRYCRPFHANYEPNCTILCRRDFATWLSIAAFLHPSTRQGFLTVVYLILLILPSPSHMWCPFLFIRHFFYFRHAVTSFLTLGC